MSHKLEYGSESHGDMTWVYTLTGDLYGNAGGYALQDEIRAKIASGAHCIVIDLSGVEKMDSAGIGVLIAIMWSASRAGGRLILAALSPKVRDLLSIAMLLDHMDHAETVEEALAKMKAGA
jgi:anti-sigma B factor antagonist